MRRFLALTILALTLTTAASQEKTAPTTPKGKLPVGWSTMLRLDPVQKKQMYAESAKYQAKIAEIRTEEYRALYKFLHEEQKAVLKSKIID